MPVPASIALVAATLQDPLPARHRTRHYEVRVEGHESEAQRVGAILEAAWPTFREFFRSEPKLREDERLHLRIFDDAESLKLATLTDGVDLPPARRDCWFSPRNKVVYLQRRASEWTTRYLAIYGACLQFHALSKPKHLDLDEWYIHGAAEHFAVHSLAAGRLELGAHPIVCTIDHPARALSELGGTFVGLDPFTEERLLDPSVRWAVARFAVEGADGRHRARFDKLALGHTGSRLSGRDFLRTLGREEDVAAQFGEWLLAQQMPFEAVQGDWEALPDGRVLATAEPDKLALCVAKPGRLRVEARVEGVLDRARDVSAVLSYESPRDFVLGRFVPPMLFVEHFRAGERVGTDPRPMEMRKDSLHVVVLREADLVRLFVEGVEIRLPEIPPGRVGFCAAGKTVTLRGLK